MAGETAIKANSTTGVYLVIENNAGIANNTPGEILLGGGTGLTLGTGYIYFDDFIDLELYAGTPKNEAMIGWSFIQDGTTPLKVKGDTGGARFTEVTLSVHATSTQMQNFDLFFNTHNYRKVYQCYLLRQWAAETFRQFYYDITPYKYLAVILTGFTSVETNKEGKDFMTLRINMVHAYRKTVP